MISRLLLFDTLAPRSLFSPLVAACSPPISAGPPLLTACLALGPALFLGCDGDPAANGATGGAATTGTGGTGANAGSGGSGAAASGGSGTAASGGSGTGGQTTAEPGCSPGLGAASEVPQESEVSAPTEPVSPFIVVDQFGYLPDSEKIAVLRNPDQGYDAAESFSPGSTYQLVDATSGESVHEGSPAPWNGGAVHEQSGDAAWWFDFSSVETPGIYYVLDVEEGVRSDLFRIAFDVYRPVLRHAVRAFFYQRAGYAKEEPYAGADWVDGASHVGAGQDSEARLYSAPSDASTERDLSGGWYDAGDYNKYSAWTADYVVSMLRAYRERPEAFGDDYELPDSGNCIADILDEARWGLEHLVRLQEPDGSVLSIVALAGASPPSAATDPSLYGPASTNATVRVGVAYAWGARIFADFDADFAADLQERAVAAFDWAQANPDVRFYNNQGDAEGIGAGQQELSDDARWQVEGRRLELALLLYQLTGEQEYKADFEENYVLDGFSLFSATWLSGWNLAFTDLYLDYTDLPNADETIRQDIVDRFNSALDSGDNLGMLSSDPDPYLAHQTDYVWGSNAQKARIGSLFYSYLTHDLDASRQEDARRAAGRYIHYLHGVNPLGLVYSSNMERAGAHQSVSEFYHTWFADGSAWDTNPAPGFLTGGPNASYDWDAQCPEHDLCPAERPAPPYGQPAQKSYADFNTGWPVNSWEVTENSNGYQVAYIRLLSKFVQ